MNQEDIRQIVALADKRQDKKYAWLRHLLLLSTGSLSALVSLGAGIHSTGIAAFAMRVAWVALGCGILLAAAALYGEVWLAAELVNKLVEAKSNKTGDATDDPGAVFAGLPEIYKTFERACYCSLALAVVSLVVFAMLR